MSGFGQQAYDKRGITDGGSCDDLVWGISEIRDSSGLSVEGST